MTDISPATATVRRRQLHKRSGFAVATALKEGARRLPPGPLRTFIAKKGLRIESCAASQQHRILSLPNKPTSVISSNARRCLDRACMNCESLRAKALAADTMDLVEYVWRLKPGARPLMLTLTSLNRPVDQTRAMVLDHQKALKAFFAFDRITTATLGQFGNIELAFENRKGIWFSHVHSHHIVLVEKGALSDHRYIRQETYVRLWQRALKVKYQPIVDIRAIRGRDGLSDNLDSIRGGVKEVSKYCVSLKKFFNHENGHPAVHPDVAVAFAVAVHRRRLSSMSGIFLEAKRLRAQERKAAAHPDKTPTT
jgi:plasmid rolling circle replication initiator protein Rep